LAAFQPPPEAQKACAEHLIDFSALVDGASRRLQEVVEQKRRDGHVAVIADEDAHRTCLLEVLLAAGRAGTAESAFGPLQAAFAAVQAAEATADPAMIQAANSHYQQTLTALIDEHDLRPVVDALHKALFTEDIRRAAH
jgi:hypothetical protein